MVPVTALAIYFLNALYVGEGPRATWLQYCVVNAVYALINGGGVYYYLGGADSAASESEKDPAKFDPERIQSVRSFALLVLGQHQEQCMKYCSWCCASGVGHARVHEVQRVASRARGP